MKSNDAILPRRQVLACHYVAQIDWMWTLYWPVDSTQQCGERHLYLQSVPTWSLSSLVG